jgi:energy-coupling factor transport system substrate-specific component
MTRPLIVLIALCAALNLALGGIVYLIKLPIYLDMVGTMLCALILATRPSRAFIAAALAGILSFVVGVVFNPFLPWFSLTVVTVAALTAFVTAKSAGPLGTAPVSSAPFIGRVVGYGVLTGIVAAIVSAPVAVYLFGGVTGSGTALLIAFFMKIGNQLLNAALLSGLTAEPIDKTLQLLLAVLLYRATPRTMVDRFRV